MSSRSPLLLVVETHPVQYRAPVYSHLNRLCPGSVHVVYASDFSLSGGYDPDFGRGLDWDSDLLSGYPCTVLRKDLTHKPISWNDLDGRGLRQLFNRLSPSAILLNSISYRFCYVAYAWALLRGIPVWMRCETQDEAYTRSSPKTALRSFFYYIVYSGISQAFPIGNLNRQHWLRHGKKSSQLRDALYCTPDRAAQLSIESRQARRSALRHQLGLSDDQLLVGSFGKLIAKKDPFLLLQSVPYLPHSIRQRMSLIFVGSGELQPQLQEQANSLYSQYGVTTRFPGFLNQMSLLDWYLATDVLVLSSRRAGETWGLVVNEAMQAGCAVVVSEAVGCAADFCGWERFRTIPVGSAKHLATALTELASFPRSFAWAAEGMQRYSIEAAAQSLASAIASLH